ncbi:hypothetical protein I7X12_11390 [Halosimplex litoreum]|uniref:Uncharacterized protein n=1 Tax=Halosimplex litoreum TaxID=1198301 RepID=A0A7T3FVG4_9EURY|nr:hypothetical protein [Halosimplex litoreum]QPV61371.1 hypothetical protein I7X12_11390 [Halosimplex litoreum]
MSTSERANPVLAFGLAAIAVALSLRLFHLNPNLPSDTGIPMGPRFWYDRPGFAPNDYPVLAWLAVVGAIHAARPRRPPGHALAFLTGIVAAGWALAAFAPWRFGTGALYVPALGWYLLVLGGVVTTVAAARELYAEAREPGRPYDEPANVDP